MFLQDKQQGLLMIVISCSSRTLGFNWRSQIFSFEGLFSMINTQASEKELQRITPSYLASLSSFFTVASVSSLSSEMIMDTSFLHSILDRNDSSVLDFCVYISSTDKWLNVISATSVSFISC